MIVVPTLLIGSGALWLHRMQKAEAVAAAESDGER